MLNRLLTSLLGIFLVVIALLVIKVPIFYILKIGAIVLCTVLLILGILVILASFLPEKS